jgi:DNA polymerase I
MKMQVFDINYKSDYDRSPIINIFGCDDSGKSQKVSVVGFKPYFYVRPHPDHFDDVFMRIMDSSEGLYLEEVLRFQPIGYQSEPSRMIKVTAVSPKDVKPMRETLRFNPYVLDIYEADILFNSRFSADTDITGMSWIDVPKGTVRAEEIKKLDKSEESEYKILSIDIECLAPEDGSFPMSEKDPINLVSMSFNRGYKGIKDLVIIAKPVKCDRSDVIAVNNEKELLKTMRNIIIDYDPDIVTGFNINEFDFPYIDTRLRKNLLACDFGRDHSDWYIRNVGIKIDVTIAGRAVVDTLPMVRKNFSLDNYKLKTIAKELLHLEKLDVEPKKMREYWFAEDERFTDFVKYSRRDAVLGMMLLTDLGMLEKYIALSKISGILLQTVVSGGQSVMLEFMLLQRYNRLNRVMALKPQLSEGDDDDESEFEGAYVSQPEVGLHDHLILTDMQSLYPSVVISNNLCPTTVIMDEEVPDGKYHVDPNGGKFVNSDILPGILPKMLDDVLKKRIETKKQMKLEVDGHKKQVLDSIQYAYKIVINSAYGWCGYKRSRLFNLTVASAVTAYGRQTIDGVRNAIEGIKDLRVNENIYNFHVIYTDTDSAYVEVTSDGEITLDNIDKVGNTVAEIVSKPMKYPMKLNYEGYARRAMFLAKKRYAMWLLEKGRNGEIKDKVKAKGIETVRRDWCRLTGNTMRKCLDLILKEGKTSEAAQYVLGVISRLRVFNIDLDADLLDDLALTRNYHKDSQGYTNLPAHMRLIDRMKKRGDQIPGFGDRISYYIVRGREDFAERAETIEFIKKNNRLIDTNYYITKQIIKPLARIFNALDINMMTGERKKHERNVFTFAGALPVARPRQPMKKKEEPKGKTIDDMFTMFRKKG